MLDIAVGTILGGLFGMQLVDLSTCILINHILSQHQKHNMNTIMLPNHPKWEYDWKVVTIELQIMDSYNANVHD